MLSRRKITEVIAAKLLAGDDKSKLMRQLAAYLHVHKQTKLAGAYIADIERQLAAHGSTVIDVTTAHELDDVLRNIIRQQFNGSGDVTLRETIDPSIIGGVIVRTPVDEFDGSVLTTLKKLRTS